MAELAAHYAGRTPARGEITVVVGPPAEDGRSRGPRRALRAALAGNSVKDAAALVTAATGLPRKVVYARALALSSEEG